MKTKLSLFRIRRELCCSGLALALLICAEAWMVWHVGRDCSQPVSIGESEPGVTGASGFLAFN